MLKRTSSSELSVICFSISVPIAIRNGRAGALVSSLNTAAYFGSSLRHGIIFAIFTHRLFAFSFPNGDMNSAMLICWSIRYMATPIFVQGFLLLFFVFLDLLYHFFNCFWFYCWIFCWVLCFLVSPKYAHIS